MKTIPLTQGKEALVDDEDYSELSKHKWCTYLNTNGEWYAKRDEWLGNGKCRAIIMHRVIMGAPKGIQVDHIRGTLLPSDPNCLDNRKSNLRLATQQQNLCNKTMQSNNTSGFKGVTWDKQTHRWMAQISVNRKHIKLGRFDSLEEAAEVYNSAAILYFGEFAKVNEIVYPDGDVQPKSY